MFANLFRSKRNGRSGNTRKAAPSNQRLRSRRLRHEPLEQRQLLSVSPAISIDDVTVDVQEGSMEFIDAFVPQGTRLDNPRGMTLTPGGDLYVSSYSTDSVLRYDAQTGELLEEFVESAAGGLNGPYAQAFGPDGNLYVANYIDDSILRYDGATGDFLDEFIATGSGGLNGPSDLIFRSDSLYVASYVGDSVLRYDATTGDFLGEFVTDGSGGLNGPGDLAFRADGLLYVSSYSTDSVLRYDADDGSFVDEFVPPGGDGLDGTRGLVFDTDGNLYVGSTITDSIICYAADGSFLRQFGSVDDGLTNPQDLILDSAGNLLVSDSTGDSVLRYDTTDGSLIDTFIVSATDTDRMDRPERLAFGPDGDLYVSSFVLDGVLRYDGTTGAFKEVVVDAETDGATYPVDMAFDSQGRLYIQNSALVLRYDSATDSTETFIDLADDYVKGVAIGPDGNLYIGKKDTGDSGYDYTYSVVCYDIDTGQPIAELTDDDLYVSGIAFGPDDNLYTISSTAINRYNAATGTFDEFVKASSGGLTSPQALAFDPAGNLYVSTLYRDTVLSYDGTTGQFLGTVASPENSPLDTALGLAFDSQGSLYVGSGSGDEVLRFGSPGQAALTVSLSSPSATTVTVDYATANDTAVAGEDYDGLSGTLAFSPGVTSRTILIPTDTAAVGAPSEAFSLNLSNPSSGATIADAQGTVVILAEATPAITINDPTVAEGEAMVFTVSMSHSVATPVSVDFQATDGTATDGVDYTADGGTLTFAPGETTKSITITTAEDAVGERDETIVMNLSNPTIGSAITDSHGVGTILVSDDIQITIADVEVAEGNHGIQFIDHFVTKEAGDLRDPTGIVFHDGMLYVADQYNDTVQRFDGVTGTRIDELDPLNMGGLNAMCDMTIGPDGVPYVINPSNDSILRYNEAIGQFEDFVSPGSGGISTPVSLAFGEDGNLYLANSRRDVDNVLIYSVLRYNGQTGTIIDEVGVGLHISRVTTNADGTLFAVSSDRIYRLNNQTSQFEEFTTHHGSGGVFNVNGMAFGPDGNLYISDDGTDSVLRYDGQTGAFIDAVVPTGSSPLYAPRGLAFDALGNLLVASCSGPNGVLRYGPASQAAVTVTLSRACHVPVSVDYATVDGTAVDGVDYAGAGGTLIFSPGETTRTILLPTILDPAGELSESFWVELGNPSAAGVIADSQAEVTILADDAPTISVSDAVAREGENVVFKVRLSKAAQTEVTVRYETEQENAGIVDQCNDGSDYIGAGGILVFAPGETVKTIAVATIDEGDVENDERFSLNLLSSHGAAAIVESHAVGWIMDLSRPLFADSFEDGEWNGLWTEDSQYDWFDSTQRATDGTYSAEVDGRATNATLTMAQPIDMSPYGSAELTFDWFIEKGLDSGEYLALDFSTDGSTWTEIERLAGNVDTENVWHNASIDIDPVYLTAGYQLRFRAKMSGSREDANVDNVRLMATSLAVPPSDPPVADAGGTYNANEGGSVTLDGSASTDPDGTLVAWEWDLDNNGSYETSGATALFDAAADGTFTVGLRVTDDAGLTDTDTATVIVANLTPTAIAGGGYSGSEGTGIQLDGTASTDPGGDTLAYAWDLDNNGSFETAGATPLFTATDEGTYTVGLRVTDSGGLSDTDTATVTVANVAPTADAGGPYAVDEGNAITLTASGSTDPGSDTLVYAWDLDGDGQYDDASGVTATFDGVTPGDFTVGVQVSDGDGGIDTDSALVTVTEVNDLPVANMGGPYAGSEGIGIALDASLSNDPDGTITAYDWDLDGDGQYDDASGVTTTFTAADNDTYTIGLRVTDDRGDTATDSTSVTVANVAPTAHAGGPYTMPEGGSITLDASASTDPGSDTLTYAWDLDGDGQYDDATGVTTSFGTTVDGLYNVGVKVTDDDGAFDESATTVTVSNVAPTADAGGTYATDEGVDVTLTAADSTDPGGDIASYAWDLDGDGTYETDGVTATFNNATAGTYTVDVLVTDDDGATGTDTATITVSAVATGPELRKGVVAANTGDWVTVTLDRSYTSMVVVLTPNYSDTDAPMVARLQNASGSSFEVKLDRADGLAGSTSDVFDVHYVVVEEGLYTEDEHGVDMEAVKFTSTVTDENNSWAGESRSYQQAYSQPVVVGQVMTNNDAWSVFWACGSSRSAAPSASALKVGKMVGEDPDATRADETIGYLVVESGTWTLDGESFVAGLGGDTIKGVDDTPAYTYSFAELPSITAAVASQAAMDGGNGGWAVLYGDSPVSTTTINLAIDEDRMKDSERRHTTEQVAFLVFDPPVEAADQVLAQGVDTPAAARYLADFTSSDGRFSKEKKDEATDLALLLMME